MTEVTTVGPWTYIRDSYAAPPADQLFVACPRRQSKVLPDVTAFVTWMKAADHVSRVGNTFHFRLPRDKELLPNPGLPAASGTVTLDHGRVKVLSVLPNNATSRKLKRTVYTLRYTGPAIEAPTPDQIARQDCQTTPFSAVPGSVVSPQRA